MTYNVFGGTLGHTQSINQYYTVHGVQNYNQKQEENEQEKR